MKPFALILVLLASLIAPAALLADPETEGVPGQAAAHGAEDVVHEQVHEGDDSHGGPGGAPETYFGIPAWILKTINLIGFVGLLWWLLAGPIGRAFHDRRAAIQRDLAEAAERRAKVDSLALDIQARLQQVETDVAAVLARAKEEGERQRQEMIAAAEAEAQKILAQARAEVEARTKSARLQLAEYARELAVERAGALLHQSITEKDRVRLFNEGVQQIAEVES